MYSNIASIATKSAQNPQPAYPRDLCVPEMVGRCAVQNSRQAALVGDAMVLTYSELDAQANQLAHHLHTLGVHPEVCVGVCMSRSPLQVLAALAVLKAGGAYLPLDPNYPSERLSFILRDAGVPILLTENRVVDTISKGGGWLSVLVDGDRRAFANYPTDRPVTTASPQHLAYVIYTSGSTGRPKGVQITHDSLLNLVFWHRSAFAVGVEDRATQLASVGFDAAVWELWPYLTTGATVYIAAEVTRSSPELLRDWLVAQKITISFVPTALAERLILLDWPPDTKLRLLLTGADTLHHYPRPGLPFQLINNYGPTEATVVATSALIPPAANPDGRPPIGRPIDNTYIYVCDDTLNPVPTGELGEIYIGGAGVARGYLNNPELTSQRFLPNPFSDQPCARIYRTGDRGRFLPDGQLAFVGRADDQIKIRGWRIEPNEIVSILNTHPAVLASAVVARQDARGNLRLLAYVVTDGQPHPTSGALRSLLLERLPDYMLPAAYIGLQALPLTPNGKTDYDALPVPDNTNRLPDEDFGAPRTVLEEKLSGIVASLLGLERIGVDDNFFLLGGHSLLGAQLIARIQESFGVELPLRSIFDLPTAAQLAREIERLIVTKLDEMSADELQRALQPTGPADGQQ